LLHRFHLLCAVPTAGWIAGVFGSGYFSDANLSPLAYTLLFCAGVVAGPFIGVSAMRALPDFFDSEDNRPRDFFLPALASSFLVCLVAAMTVTAAMGK
jgi:hypothetical protein